MEFDSSATVEQVILSKQFQAKVEQVVDTKRREFPEIDLDHLKKTILDDFIVHFNEENGRYRDKVGGIKNPWQYFLTAFHTNLERIIARKLRMKEADLSFHASIEG
ncbi:MAG: hypothetical protein AAFN77_24235 [Planctomycetota bacterium]